MMVEPTQCYHTLLLEAACQRACGRYVVRSLSFSRVKWILLIALSDEPDAHVGSWCKYPFIDFILVTLEYKRGEYRLAQHCVGLSMTENLLPGGNSRIWLLWADIACKMENEKLMNQCREQAFLLIEAEKGGTASALSRILEERAITSDT